MHSNGKQIYYTYIIKKCTLSFGELFEIKYKIFLNVNFIEICKII